MLARLLLLVTLGCCAAGLLVTLAVTLPLTLAVLARGAAFALAYPLGYATIGLVLSVRRPANPISWLYAASGLASSLGIPLEPWVTQLASDGRLGHRGGGQQPATGHYRGFADRQPAGPGRAGRADRGLATWAAVTLFVASLLAALACVVLRFRASRGVQRQQLCWVATGAAGTVATTLVILPVALSGIAPDVPVVLSSLALLCVPVAVAVAILRYRLFDLDRLVTRTVTYGLVTGLLVLPYLLILPAATRLAQEAGSLAVAAATLAAAAGFQPLRRRVQDLVDRRFNRRRYDAARTVAAFAARLQEEIDLDVLQTELVAVVDQTMQPTTTWLRLRPSPAPSTVAGAAMAQRGSRR